MLPFVPERRNKALRALKSDFLFLAVFGEHCMIRHTFFFLLKESKPFFCRNAITGQEVGNSQPLLETRGWKQGSWRGR